MGVSALAGTISAPFAVRAEGTSVARWLRSVFSLLLAVGVLAIALPAAFGSGAKGAGVNPVRVFSSGSLVALNASGGAQLSIGGLVPGQSRSATVQVSNPGSASTSFSLTPQLADHVGPGGAPLSGALVLRIASRVSGAVVYDGPIGAMPRLGLGAVAAGAQRAYRFTVTLPESVGNEVAGSSLSAGFAWNAG